MRLDRIIRDKLKLREVQDLSTEFETSRLQDPPGGEEEEESENGSQLLNLRVKGYSFLKTCVVEIRRDTRN